jgi:hypothetical protein
MAGLEFRRRIPLSPREITPPLHGDTFTFREHDRRSEVSAEAEPGRKAGTDQGTTVARLWLREFQKASARRSPSGSLREVRERSLKASHFYPFPLEKSPRPFGEVLSFEFWVLSCLAQFLDVGEGRSRLVWSMGQRARRARLAGIARRGAGLSRLSGLSGWPDRKINRRNQRDQKDRMLGKDR